MEKKKDVWKENSLYSKEMKTTSTCRRRNERKQGKIVSFCEGTSTGE
jgi:hypothetical protein